MMKKRKSPFPRGEHNQDEDSEMVIVDAEEKVDAVEDDDSGDDDKADDDDDAEEEEAAEEGDESVGDDAEEARNPVENTFMDSFYGLSSSNPAERAQAANALLHHCLMGPDANIKDAAYAFRRLLNGLCSGRAASRQGNASALASFLKVTYEGGQLEEIRSQHDSIGTRGDGDEASMLEYVRQRLLKATNPSDSEGKVRGSEERDYQFGRLFGVLSIARSGILFPTGGSGSTTDKTKSYDVDEIMGISTGLVSDLVELYWHKKWMREPAAHAIGTVLNTFYSARHSAGGDDAEKIAHHLVEELVIPKLLMNESGGYSIQEYGPDQIALAATIQSHIRDHPDGLPSPLDKPIISTETIPIIANTLAKTSSVTQPRMHLVWDSIWLFLTEPVAGQKKPGSRQGLRKMRDEPLIGGDSSRDIIESLVRHVVVEGLLKVDAGDGGGKVTHEQRALALCVVRNLLGVPFNSSITGPTTIQLSVEDFETILTPIVIRRLFLDVICAGGGGPKKAHHVKPLALQILQSLVESMSQDVSESTMKTKQAISQCFVRCEPRFDALTKTTTISELVGLGDAPIAEFGTDQMSAWQIYFDFLEGQIISSAEADIKAVAVQGNVDLLYQSAKRLLRVEQVETTVAKEEFEEFKAKSVERILGFFMACSFFDCKNLSEKTPSKKKKKGKSKDTATNHPVVQAGLRLNRFRAKSGNDACLPYEARYILSERFYSLLAEYVNASLHSGAGSGAKDSTLLDIVENFCTGWKMIETAGAKPFFSAIVGGGNDDGESESPEKILFQLQGLAKDLDSSSQDSEDLQVKARKRCGASCAALASTLFLHLLGCGRPQDIMDEDDVMTEDDDDSADIIEAIEAIGEITPAILGTPADSEENPLAAIAEICINLFSSRICSSTPGRGASPRLLREAIKFTWMGVLSVSATADKDLFDADVASVLLNGIGAGPNEMDDKANAEHEDGDESDDSMDDDESSSGDLGDFSKVGKILGGGDDDDSEGESDSTDKSPEPQKAEDDEQDVEISSDKLNSLLEDDSDAEVDAGELEHHEGADAALAMLIKMKQDARKSSRQARERLELEKQLRCSLLLETVLGKSESWAGALRSDVILQMIPPLLAYRNRIEKSLQKGSGKASGADVTTKKAMVDRLTSILKTKLFKLKFAGMPTSGPVELVDCCRTLALSLMDMARRKSSKDQRALCSAGLVTVLKALHGSDGVLDVASVYVAAVEEWSSKGTTRLEASLFDDLVHRCPSVAQVTLITPLASAGKSARSPFLRCESFRILSMLLHEKLNPRSSEFDELAMKKTKESLTDVSASICAALKDAAMQKSKRIREVLKTAEKLLVFSKSCSTTPSNLARLEEAISELQSKHNNPGVQLIIEKLNAVVEQVKQGPEESLEGEEDAEMEDLDNEANGSKKDKKKKKKKKRGKK